MSATTPELEHATAQEVLAYGVERFHPRLKTACSFQKEETVLAHMLSEIAPEAKLFTIDTGVLFPETLATWKRFEERFGLDIEVIDASSPGAPWTRENCCGQAKVDGLEQALAGVEAWVTGIRREQSPTRADSAKFEPDEKRGIWKLNPLADWSDKDVWEYIFKYELPYNPLHDHGYDSIGCASCTLPGSGRDGRWAGDDKTECGIHL
ncbi:MAG TPA: phosphoadenylyl-sulfate reductase [Solirubrobacteraceae bacterium]|nr:phosphoadenylyl-sulfate reductase [Solirubrobacteraceae bacterium]